MSWDNDPSSTPSPGIPAQGAPVPPPPPTPPVPSSTGDSGAYTVPTAWAPAPPAPPAPPNVPDASAWGSAPTPPPDLPRAESDSNNRRRPLTRTLGAIVVVVGLFGIGFGTRSILDNEQNSIVSRSTTVMATADTIDPGSEPIAAVAAVVSPSVVQIETSSGLGSGVFYDPSGLIMTNAHVIGNEKTVTVRSPDGKSVKGEVLGSDTGTDVAVVRVSGLSVPAAVLSSAKPAVGQIAVAIGSPFGLDQTVTSGIVSAVNRPVDNEKGVVVNMIQTDASINPGNSGGALSNRNGEIIGINTAIFSQSGENNGIGFAIPIRTAKAAADKLVAGQAVTKAGLGLSGPTETPDGEAGAYVQSVTDGGAASGAGIQAGDIIVSVDGTPIRSFEELRGTISAFSPGDVVTITYVRDGQTRDTTVTLGTLGR